MSTTTLSAIAKVGVAGLGAFFGYVFGEWTVLLQVLTAMIILDYASGVLASGVEGKLSSKVGFKGIAKKLAIFLFVAVAHFIDKAVGHGSMVQDSVVFFYIGNELISLIENGGRIGLPVPAVLQKAVDIFKAKGNVDPNEPEVKTHDKTI